MADIISSVDGILNVYDDGTIDIVGGSLHIDGTEVLAGNNAAVFTSLSVDSPTFVVDAVNNRVGIGTATPNVLLNLAASSGNSILELQRTNTNTTGTVGAISFTALDGHSVSSIYSSGDGDDDGAHLIFATTSAASSNSYFTSTTERMRITSGGNVNITNDLTVGGNLTVEGTTTTLNTATLDVEDLNITIAKNAANAAAADGAGLTVDGANATLLYKSTADAWSFNKAVGIGTTDPDDGTAISTTAMLHVYNNTASTNPSIVVSAEDNDEASLILGENSSSLGYAARLYYEGNGDNFFNIRISDSGTEHSPAFTIDRNDRVGIGTITPNTNTKLDVAAAGKFLSNSSNSRVLYLQQHATNAGNIIQFMDQTGADTWEVVGRNNNFYIYNNTASLGAFKIHPTNNNTWINPGANYINDPGYQLRVSGDTYFEETTSGTTNLVSYFRDNRTTTSAHNYTVGFSRQNSDVASLYIGNNDSNEAIIAANNTSLRFGKDVSGTLSEYMVITSNGDVGIGTNSPDERVHIAGGSLLLDVANVGSEEGIFFRDGFSDSNKYNISILAYDHNGSFPDGLSINGYDGISFNTGSNTRNEVMRIQGGASNAGFVGINTTGPTARLDVRSAGADGQEVLRIESSGDVANGGYHWMSSAIASSQSTDANIVHLIGQAESTKNSGYLGFYYAGAGSNNNYVSLGGFGANHLLNVMMDGRVGIGTSSPDAVMLTIRGNATRPDPSVRLIPSSTSDVRIDFFNNAGTAQYYFGWDQDVNQMKLADSAGFGAPIMTWDTSERVGINTSTLNSALTIVNTTTQPSVTVTSTESTWDASIVVGNTTISNTLLDTNDRPAIVIDGAYPVLNLNSSANTNTNHGPTIQFTFDGHDTNRQWVMGSGGTGAYFDIGTSGGSAGTNSTWNPHHGISGHSGKTVMRFFETGAVIGETGALNSHVTSINSGTALDIRSVLEFTSPDTTNQIKVSMTDADVLSFIGDAGQLLSLSDNTTGTIFSVNDVSGVPSIEVDDDGTIRLAETFGNVLIGTSVDDGTNKLQVKGSVSLDRTITTGPGNDYLYLKSSGTQKGVIGLTYNDSPFIASADTNMRIDSGYVAFGNNNTGTIVNNVIDLGHTTYRLKDGYFAGTVYANSFSGTASNANTLDNLDSTQFLRSDANDTTTGILTVDNDTGIKVIYGVETTNVFYTGYGIDSQRVATYIRPTSDNTQTLYIGGSAAANDWNSIELKVGDVNSVNINGNTVWHSGNDGSGSGLDADTIDGWVFANSGSNSGKAANSLNSNAIVYYTSDVDNFSGNATDGAIYAQYYSSSWQHQIAGDYRSGNIALRGKNNNSWQRWKKVPTIYTSDSAPTTALVNDDFWFDSDEGKLKIRYAGTWVDTFTLGTSNFVQKSGDTMTGSLNVQGNIVATGDVTAYGTVSDIRQKENIVKLDNAMEKVGQLNGYTFNYKGHKERLTGVIAQEVEKVLPEAVYETQSVDLNETIMAVRHGNMVGLLIEAMKEQQEQINMLKAEIEKLKGE